MTGRGRTVRRSVALAAAFRFEQSDPDRFYRRVSADAATLLGARVHLAGALVLDVGGGAGYLSRALRQAGAGCVLVDDDPDELRWRGAPDPCSVLADGYRLPAADGSMDVVVSCNVLEHVARPFALVDEMVRVLRPGGHLWVSFTNWYGPWGGHETSPWHYLGGERAARRYAARTGRYPKNRLGESLFPLHVGTVLRRFARHEALEVLDARPRYLPGFAARLVRVPLVREVATWNLELLARRRPESPCDDASMSSPRRHGSR